jgi:GT2 family glycosyltransferase
VDAEYFQLINPDLIISPDFVEKMLIPFEQTSRLGAVGGKLLKYDFKNNMTSNLIDSTGVVIRKTGRAVDRGQHEEDVGQYDQKTQVIAVSGAAAMYSMKALKDIVEPSVHSLPQYFDEDFHSYFEDVDLCWRMYNRAWEIRFQPEAIAWHGRAVAASPGGYSRLISYVRHRKKIPLAIRKLNYRNHIFLFMKNSPRWYLKFFAREIFYNLYVLIFEPTLLTALPGILREIPTNTRKRKAILRRRKISRVDAEKLLE